MSDAIALGGSGCFYENLGKLENELVGVGGDRGVFDVELGGRGQAVVNVFRDGGVE